MIRYNVRSRQIIDLIGDIRRNRLVLSPYFQRNLVWRDIHKKDFIDTILRGYPFPQIFIAKGPIDVEKMINTSCIVDGQQRMSTIMQFVDDKFSYEGTEFSSMSVGERENFLKYEVAVIDLDLDENDPLLFEIFKRLNRTYYSLSQVERLATEFSSSEFMLTAKLFTRQLLDRSLASDDEDVPTFTFDPNIPSGFTDWSRDVDVAEFQRFIINERIFTPYELSRMVHLMFVLNLMATYIGGFYNRNDLAKTYLEQFNERFERKDDVAETFEQVASIFNNLDLDDRSMWYNKSNVFTLFCILARSPNVRRLASSNALKEKLQFFSDDTPSEYALAAREGVNNKKERETRDRILREFILA